MNHLHPQERCAYCAVLRDLSYWPVCSRGVKSIEVTVAKIQRSRISPSRCNVLEGAKCATLRREQEVDFVGARGKRSTVSDGDCAGSWIDRTGCQGDLSEVSVLFENRLSIGEYRRRANCNRFSRVTDCGTRSNVVICCQDSEVNHVRIG